MKRSEYTNICLPIVGVCHPPSTWMYSSTQKLSQLCIFFFFLMEASLHRLPCGSAGKEYPCNAEDLGSIPGLGRSPGEGKGYPLQYSCLENSMDCIVHGISKSWTWLSDFHFTSLYFITQTWSMINSVSSPSPLPRV